METNLVLFRNLHGEGVEGEYVGMLRGWEELEFGGGLVCGALELRKVLRRRHSRKKQRLFGHPSGPGIWNLYDSTTTLSAG